MTLRSSAWVAQNYTFTTGSFSHTHLAFPFQKGEIAFVDLERQKMVLRTSVTGHITRLQVVPDDRQHITYLLVSIKKCV